MADKSELLRAFDEAVGYFASDWDESVPITDLSVISETTLDQLIDTFTQSINPR